ncbi:MAG: dienelactone hydrolase family protein [Desulfatiglandaceae bacterium]|jgi:dienelactone hydrolase
MRHNRVWIILACLFLWGSVAQGAVVTRTIPYRQGGVDFQGYLAYDNALQGKRPGVLIVHEWWGLNDYARKRAEQLASLGYVAFALDMYGKGKVAEHPKQAEEFMNEVTGNVVSWQKRALAGLDVLKRQPGTDSSRIAAIGYCFGGSTVQQLAYSGADIRGIVSFHGSLIPPTPSEAGQTKAKILICHGAADPFVKPELVQKYIAAMNASQIDWQMVIFGHAKHSFTNPGADKYGMPQLSYNRQADLRSWEYMRLFFKEIFSK